MGLQSLQQPWKHVRDVIDQGIVISVAVLLSAWSRAAEDWIQVLTRQSLSAQRTGCACSDRVVHRKQLETTTAIIQGWRAVIAEVSSSRPLSRAAASHDWRRLRSKYEDEYSGVTMLIHQSYGMPASTS